MFGQGVFYYFVSLPLFTDKLIVEVKYAVLTDPCTLEEIGEEFSRKPYALAVQKGSPLKDMLSERQVEQFLVFQCSMIQIFIFHYVKHTETAQPEGIRNAEGEMVDE